MVNNRKRNCANTDKLTGGESSYQTPYSLRSQCTKKTEKEEKTKESNGARTKNIKTSRLSKNLHMVVEARYRLRSSNKTEPTLPSNAEKLKSLRTLDNVEKTKKSKLERVVDETATIATPKFCSNERNMNVDRRSLKSDNSGISFKHSMQIDYTRPNEESTSSNYRQLRLRPVIDTAGKQQNVTKIPERELFKIEKGIIQQKKTPTVIREYEEKITQGSLVLIKWPSYPYWPARIVDICRNVANVVFFGDGGCVLWFSHNKPH